MGILNLNSMVNHYISKTILNRYDGMLETASVSKDVL